MLQISFTVWNSNHPYLDIVREVFLNSILISARYLGPRWCFSASSQYFFSFSGSFFICWAHMCIKLLYYISYLSLTICLCGWPVVLTTVGETDLYKCKLKMHNILYTFCNYKAFNQSNGSKSCSRWPLKKCGIVGFVHFMVKQLPLQMKIYKTESGRNGFRRHNADVFHFHSCCIRSCLPTSSLTLSDWCYPEILLQARNETQPYLGRNLRDLWVWIVENIWENVSTSKQNL